MNFPHRFVALVRHCVRLRIVVNLNSSSRPLPKRTRLSLEVSLTNIQFYPDSLGTMVLADAIRALEKERYFGEPSFAEDEVLLTREVPSQMNEMKPYRSGRPGDDRWRNEQLVHHA